MLLGFILMCAAGILLWRNHTEDIEAEASVEAVMPEILEKIPLIPPEEKRIEQLTPVELLPPSAFEMTRVEIGGYDYIGYLSIPALELELPIMADWNYGRLQIAPCRYHGSVNGRDLVLMAHNYYSHFGRISELQPGDVVLFTDMDGFTTHYLVEGRDVLDPKAVEEMTAGEFDLTLFTCTYGGKSRVTVYCTRILEK
jgi:sortase A